MRCAELLQRHWLRAPWPFNAGDNARVDFAGSFHEIRSGSFALLVPQSGPRSVELKVRGEVAGLVGITPTVVEDGPSYVGAYSERVVGWISDHDNDTFRVGHFRLRGRLVGSDGSSLVLESAFKVTLRPDGTAVVDRRASTCQ